MSQETLVQTLHLSGFLSSVRPGPCRLGLCQVALGWLCFLWRTTSRTQGPLQVGNPRPRPGQESVSLLTQDAVAAAGSPRSPSSQPGVLSCLLGGSLLLGSLSVSHLDAPSPVPNPPPHTHTQ